MKCAQKSNKSLSKQGLVLSWALSSPLALSLTWRVATQPFFLHRISVVHVYLYIAATTPDPVGRDPCPLVLASLQLKGETGHTPYLGHLAQTLGS